MTDQVRISDDGSLEIERTWDGEPLYSPATVQEGLFAGDAFQQMRGQTAIEGLETYWEPCCDCGGNGTLREWGLETRKVTCNRCQGGGNVLVSIPIGGDR